ncbi:uncharacterized protein [Epargyreus clarus]|uniref:uncharacterized protein n=1 Tax=Epargyreus clarus TaxID=520877 RepID=UPI003C2E92BF
MSIPNLSSKLKRPSSTSFRDVEANFRPYLKELRYGLWCSRERLYECLEDLPDNTMWNSVICIMALAAIVWEAICTEDNLIGFLDIFYNVLYAVHVLNSAYILLTELEFSDLNWMISFGFIFDILSYSHYLITFEDDTNRFLKLICYYLRLHRPFRYFWSRNNYNMKGSIIGTTLMYCYIFLVVRITWALVWLNIDQFEEYSEKEGSRRALIQVQRGLGRPGGREELSDEADVAFLSALYIVNKMFIPIGPSVPPSNDIERIACLLVMISGCLTVSGAAVASLSLVIGIYMRPEESFRARYRLIMREMKHSHVPLGLREKVETFYKMYWQKQKAVSSTELLPIFPPTIHATVNTDIYFKATQKSRILRDLSYQFLSEVAKNMHTIHYIPGDTIIKRSTKKSSIIYITYGDVEMLTAEDDMTAILRMTRGTILSPCGPCPVAGCARAHVEIRAATFCTAHVLKAIDLWKIVVKHGIDNRQGAIILASFDEHFDKVKRHYFFRIPDDVKYKSSILHFKRNLMNLQESKDESGKSLVSFTDVMLEIAGCYIKRNRTDASLTDEADAICLRPTFPCILQPNSSLQVAWHSFVACVVIIVCITHPYYLVYAKEVSLEFRFYDYVVTVIYGLDLIVHLSTGANIEDGIPITLAQTSSQQARSRWFVLDVVGTLPIFEFIGEGHFAGINKLLRLPKVFRVLKAMEDECVYHSNVLRFISFSLMIIISCYLIAALQQGFMCFHLKHCRVSNFTHSPFWEKKPSDDETVKNRILFSLYWSISMITFTTHMDSWGTENWNNVMYTMIVLEICIVLHTFIEAVYSATIIVTTALRENFDASIETVKHFLVRNEVNPQLRQRFITYLQLCWYNDKAYSTLHKKKTIFHDLPPHVYQDIVTRQRSKYILCIPFMKLLHRDDLRNVSSNARMFYTAPREILLNTGDITNEMYVIKQGICEILDPETRNSVGELGVRSHFGVLECLLRLPAFYTIRAVTHVQVFCISRKYLLNALKIPKINDAIEFAKKQPEYNNLQLRRERFVSYEPESPAPNTERFRLPRKHEQDSAFLQPFNKLGFLSVLRYIFPRFTIRPDGRYLLHCEWLRAVCALLSAMVFPSYTYLVLQWPWLYSVTLLLDLSAYFDLFQRMLVGYYNDKGILVYHPSSTTAHYLKGAFLIDLFGCLPLEFLESNWRDSFMNRYRITTTRQVLMLNRLLQLYRTPNALLGLAKYLRQDILLVITAIPMYIALINVLTCFMVMYSTKIFYSVDDDEWLIIPRNDKGGSWIYLFKNNLRYDITESPWNLHLTCFFWVIYETTSTGYDFIKPSNLRIMEVLLVGMIIGALIVTYFSVRIISIRANVNKLLAAFQQDMKDMAAFMRRERLSRKLQREVMDYYINDWEKMGGTDYRNILKLCDQVTLRSDAILNIFGPSFMMCPILTQCDVSLLRMMGRAVRSYHFLKDTVIVEKDDVIADIYFIDRGSVEVIANKDNVVVLDKGSIFGNLEGPSTIRYPLTVIATKRVHLLQMSAQVFHSIIKEFPSVAELLIKFRPNNEHYIEGIPPTIMSDHSRMKQSFISPIVARHRRLFQFLHFRSPILHVFFIIISLNCIYADVYNAGFLDNRFGLIVALYAHDMAFCWKFLIHYLSPYVADDDEDVTKELLGIRRAYFKREFKIDILSCLPIELLSFLHDGDPWLLFAWLRLNRLLRVVTVYKSLKLYHKHYFINLTITTVFSVLIWSTVFVHIATCLWYFIGTMEEAAAPKSSWIYDDDGNSLCRGKYVCSLYFVLTTFTQNGVGDILPKKKNEVIFVSILQVISTLVYMIYVGEFSNLIQYQSFRSFSYYCKYLELQEFLKNNRVSKNLVKMVNKYSLHLWRESRGVQVPNFLENAPNCLKLKVMSAAYLHHLTGHYIFGCCEPAFLRQLVGCLKLYIYNKGTYVVKQHEITNAMYILHTGRVVATCENDRTSKVYYSGEFFGVVHGLTSDYPHTHSYQSISKAQILTLRLEDWEYLLSHFPNSKECIYKSLTYDDGSTDTYKERPVKRDRKVTIADFEPDFFINSKDHIQTTTHNLKTSSSDADGRKLTEIYEDTAQPDSESNLLLPTDNLQQKISDHSVGSTPAEVKELEKGSGQLYTISSGVEPSLEPSQRFEKLSADTNLNTNLSSSSLLKLETMETVLQNDFLSGSNLSLEEITTTNGKFELIEKSVEDHTEKTYDRKDSSALVPYSKTDVNKPREKAEEPTSTSLLKRRSVHYHNDKEQDSTDSIEENLTTMENDMQQNNVVEENDFISQNIESVSPHDSDSNTSINKRRKLERKKSK